MQYKTEYNMMYNVVQYNAMLCNAQSSTLQPYLSYKYHVI